VTNSAPSSRCSPGGPIESPHAGSLWHGLTLVAASSAFTVAGSKRAAPVQRRKRVHRRPADPVRRPVKADRSEALGPFPATILVVDETPMARDARALSRRPGANVWVVNSTRGAGDPTRSIPVPASEELDAGDGRIRGGAPIRAIAIATARVIALTAGSISGGRVPPPSIITSSSRPTSSGCAIC
jgi:hypothetical protein